MVFRSFGINTVRQNLNEVIYKRAMCNLEIGNVLITGNIMYYVSTLSASTPQNGKTHSNNLSAKADKLFQCV